MPPCGDVSEGARAGGGSTNTVVPACLRELMQSCGIEGLCGRRATDGGETRCYASGATLTIDGQSCNPGNVASVERGFSPDGGLCFSRTTLLNYSHACETGTISISDGAGTVIATGGVSWSRTGPRAMVTCLVNGETGPPPGAHSLCPGSCP